MKVTTYSAFRQNLKSFMDSVLSTHTPLFITRSKGDDIVVISKEDYDSMQETFYLLKTPNNATHLLKWIQQYKDGKMQEHKLIEE